MEAKEPSSISSGTGGAVRVGPGEGRTIRMAGLQLTRKVSGERTGGAYSLFEAEVGSGGGEGPHIQHREDECFYVLEGRFAFRIEGEVIEAGPGSLVYVPRGALHAFRNTGETTGRMLVSQTPGGAYEGFVEEIGEPATGEAAIPRDDPPEAERTAAVGAEYGVETVPSLP